MADKIQFRRDNLSELIGVNPVAGWGEPIIAEDADKRLLYIGTSALEAFNDLRPFANAFDRWPGQLNLIGDGSGNDNFQDGAGTDEYHHQPRDPGLLHVETGLDREVTILFDRTLAHTLGERVTVTSLDATSFNVIVSGLGPDGLTEYTLTSKDDAIEVRFAGAVLGWELVWLSKQGGVASGSADLVMSSRPVETADFTLATSDFGTVIQCAAATSSGMVVTVPGTLIDALTNECPRVQIQALPASAGAVQIRVDNGGGVPGEVSVTRITEYVKVFSTLFTTFTQPVNIQAGTQAVLVEVCYQGEEDSLTSRQVTYTLDGQNLPTVIQPGTSDRGRFMPGHSVAFMKDPPTGDIDLVMNFFKNGLVTPTDMKALSFRVIEMTGVDALESIIGTPAVNTNSLGATVTASDTTSLVIAGGAQQTAACHNAGGPTVNQGAITNSGLQNSANDADRHSWALAQLDTPAIGSNTMTFSFRGISDAATAWAASLSAMAGGGGSTIEFMPIAVPRDVNAGEGMEIQFQGDTGYARTDFMA